MGSGLVQALITQDTLLHYHHSSHSFILITQFSSPQCVLCTHHFVGLLCKMNHQSMVVLFIFANHHDLRMTVLPISDPWLGGVAIFLLRAQHLVVPNKHGKSTVQRGQKKTEPCSKVVRVFKLRPHVRLRVASVTICEFEVRSPFVMRKAGEAQLLLAKHLVTDV